MKLKIELYIVSLWLLFMLVIINSIEFTSCLTCSYSGVFFVTPSFHILENLVSISAFLFLCLGVFYYKRFQYIIDGTKNRPEKILKIEDVNYEHLTFLTTYIIPLVCFDLGQFRHVLVLVVLLVAIGAIYIKTNLFYANPTLALLGFKIYKVEDAHGHKMIYISKQKLKEDDLIRKLELDSKIYFVTLLE